MESLVYCLVDSRGRVLAAAGVQSYAEVARAAGVDEEACQQFRFDLATRRLLRDRGDAEGERVVRAYLDEHVGTPEKLVALADAGRLPKLVLAGLLLAPEPRRTYLEACAAIEKRYTEECKATNDPCLESGCGLDEEICLQPLLRAGSEYDRACAAEWRKLFADPANRVHAWAR